MQIKTTVRYNITPVRMEIIKKNLQTINAGEAVGGRKPSCTSGGNVNTAEITTATVENSMESP